MVTSTKFRKAANAFAKSSGINLPVWAETDKRHVLSTAEFARSIAPNWLPSVLIQKNELSMLLGAISPIESAGLVGLQEYFFC
jgi:hypothetical protein